MKYGSSLVILGLLSASCSSRQEEKPQANAPSVQDSRTVSTVATVEALNLETRMITLRGPHGDTSSFKVDDRVKNLDQVKVGDQVVVDYYESLAIQVVKPEAAVSGQELVVDTAEPGELPGGKAVQKTTIVATIEAIDHSAPSITLRGSDGNLTTVLVRHPERLKLVKVGDTLKITFEQALAISVRPAPPTAH
jgi:hypothetical protein